MISRMTIFSLLLTLLLGAAIRVWTQGRRDACYAYLAGDPRAPSTEYVVAGTRTVIVSCNDWLPRQSKRVQILCLLELLLAALLLVNAIGDARDWFERRRDNWA